MQSADTIYLSFPLTPFEPLDIALQDPFELMFGKQLDTVTGAMGTIYENGYYRTAFELQKGVGICFDVGKVNPQYSRNPHQNRELWLNGKTHERAGLLHPVHNLSYQKLFRLGKVNREETEKVLSKPWAVDGKNFSERIWGNKEKLINEVHIS